MGLVNWLMKKCGCADDPESDKKKPIAVRRVVPHQHVTPSPAVSAVPNIVVAGSSPPNRQIIVAATHISRGGLLSRDNSGENDIKLPMLHMVSDWPAKSTYKDNIGNYFYLTNLKMLVRIHNEQVAMTVAIKNLDGFIAAANKGGEFKVGGKPIALSYEAHARIITENQEPPESDNDRKTAPPTANLNTNTGPVSSNNDGTGQTFQTILSRHLIALSTTPSTPHLSSQASPTLTQERKNSYSTHSTNRGSPTHGPTPAVAAGVTGHGQSFSGSLPPVIRPGSRTPRGGLQTAAPIFIPATGAHILGQAHTAGGMLPLTNLLEINCNLSSTRTDATAAIASPTATSTSTASITPTVTARSGNSSLYSPPPSERGNAKAPAHELGSPDAKRAHLWPPVNVNDVVTTSPRTGLKAEAYKAKMSAKEKTISDAKSSPASNSAKPPTAPPALALAASPAPGDFTDLSAATSPNDAAGPPRQQYQCR